MNRASCARTHCNTVQHTTKHCNILQHTGFRALSALLPRRLLQTHIHTHMLDFHLPHTCTYTYTRARTYTHTHNTHVLKFHLLKTHAHSTHTWSSFTHLTRIALCCKHSHAPSNYQVSLQTASLSSDVIVTCFVRCPSLH